MVREQGALCLYGSRRSEELLGWEWCEFVCNGIAAKCVFLRRIRDLEDAMIEGVGVKTSRLLDGCFADLVEVAIRVRLLVLRNAVGFFVGDGVVVAIDCRIDTYA